MPMRRESDRDIAKSLARGVKHSALALFCGLPCHSLLVLAVFLLKLYVSSRYYYPHFVTECLNSCKTSQPELWKFNFH